MYSPPVNQFKKFDRNTSGNSNSGAVEYVMGDRSLQ